MWRFIRVRRPGYELRLHPAALSLALWVNGGDRSLDSRIVRSLLQPGDTYVDVGANVGHLAIEGAMAVGPAGRVFAFEPHPRVAGFLRENLRLNGLDAVSIAQVAVGDRAGWTRLTDSRSDDQNRISASTGDITVPMMRLDDLLGGVEVKLLKVDVEGFEKYVFQGAAELLSAVRFVYFEADESQYNLAGYGFSDVYDILVAKGLAIGLPQGERLRPVDRHERFVETVNLLAYRDRAELCRSAGFVDA